MPGPSCVRRAPALARGRFTGVALSRSNFHSATPPGSKSPSKDLLARIIRPRQDATERIDNQAARSRLLDSFCCQPLLKPVLCFVAPQHPTSNAKAVPHASASCRRIGTSAFSFTTQPPAVLFPEVLQLCSHAVIGWLDAPSGLFGLRSIQMASI
jgi:hypothetical protein